MIKLLHLVDDTLNYQTASNCDLLIHLGNGRFQYAVIDRDRDELKAIVDYQLAEIGNLHAMISEVEKLPECNREFKYPYHRIKLSFNSFKYTFIPEELFETDKQQEYSKFINPSASDLILMNKISATPIRNIFGVNSSLNNKLNKLFHKPRIYNQASAFIEGITKTCPDRNTNTLFIDFQANQIQIAYLKKTKLEFYNLFECLHADEFNYFLLNTIETLNLDLRLIKIILSGDMQAENDENYKRVAKYFETPIFADNRAIVSHLESFQNISFHTYFSLLSLNECE